MWLYRAFFPRLFYYFVWDASSLVQPTQIWFPFKTSPLPGDDVTESRAGEPHLTVICQASGSRGARQGSRVGSPRSRLFTSTPGHQPGTLRLSNKERARASLGEGLPPPHRSPRGTLPNLGSNGFLFFLFFFLFFLSSWLPTARKPGPPELEREQGGRSVVRRSVPDSTGNVSFSKTAPTRAS